MIDSRTIVIPEGLQGERLDSAVARLFGFSRSFSQTVIASGGVFVEGKIGSKSDRVSCGEVLEVTFEPREPPTIEPVVVDSMKILYIGFF